MYYDIFHIKIVWHKIKYKLKGKILLAKVTPAFGVTLDGMEKFWTNSSSALVNNLE